jgi:hypothetical protein
MEILVILEAIASGEVELDKIKINHEIQKIMKWLYTKI